MVVNALERVLFSFVCHGGRDKNLGHGGLDLDLEGDNFFMI
jgi:hypothetical protein